MTYENPKDNLAGEPGKIFVKNLTVSIYDFTVKISAKYGSYDFIHYRIFDEVTVREYTGRLTRFNEPDPDHYRFDCVFFVEPNQAALNKKQVYTVGIKLKNNKNDLMNDDNMEHYIGYTDFFFIGVPEGLVADAINRAYDNELIGVFCVDNGKIHLMPHRINPTVERQKNLLEQIMYSSMFKADFKNNISFKVDDVEIIPPTFNNIEKGNAQEATTTIEQSISTKDERLFAREKELQRQERHNTKVAIIQQELNDLNKDVPSEITQILSRLSLGDQRVYHVIRRNGGAQAQDIADLIPKLEGIDNPSLSTIKRTPPLRALTAIITGIPRELRKRKIAKQLIISLLATLSVGITGLEPATSRPPDVCATNCAKSRSLIA